MILGTQISSITKDKTDLYDMTDCYISREAANTNF
jgi:hypothetical protein